MDRDRKSSPSALDGLMKKELTRRNVLHGAGAGVVFCAIGNGPGYGDTLSSMLSGGGFGSGNLAPNAVTQIPMFQVDLPIPSVLAPYSSTSGADYYNVDITNGSIDILTGLVNGAGPTDVFGYAPAGGDPTVPGPTIKARSNRRTIVTQNNKLPGGQDSVVHLHGGVTEPASDGHPMDIITPNNSRVYTYHNKQDAATLWYHEHGHGHTAAGVYAGLAAFYLVSDDLEDSLNLPSGEYDIPLFVTDRAFQNNGNFEYAPSLLSAYSGQGWMGLPGVSPTVNLVNGAPNPRLQVQRRKYRFRILNGANARNYNFTLTNPDGLSFQQVGTDVGLLEKPIVRQTLPLAPAERGDVVIDFSSMAVGSTVELRNTAAGIGQINNGRVMRFDVVAGGGSDDFEVRSALAEPKTLPSASIQRTFVLSQGPSNPGHYAQVRNEWQINGMGYDDHRIDIRPRQGTAEIWHFVNKSNFYHPMHVHLGHFKVVSRNGRPVAAHEGGWKDTVLVNSQETVSVLAYFGGFTGRYVYHCHALEHGDLNMMGQMEVTN